MPPAGDLVMDAFGLRYGSRFALPGFRGPTEEHPGVDVHLELVPAREVDEAWKGGGTEVWATSFEAPFSVHAGAAGDHLFTYGTARFHVSSQADRVLCCPGAAPPHDWLRQFLDTVLHSVGLIRGGTALHAGAVQLDDAAVAIVAASGSGKTTLAAELIRRGARLLSDDVLFMRSSDGEVLGCPGPPLMNLPVGAEIEGVTTTLDHFGVPPEAWVSVGRMSDGPARIGAVFFLDRGRDHTGARARAIEPTPLRPLAHFIGFPHLPGEAQRFHLAADLAAATPMYALEADLETSPAELAGLVERTAGLDSPRARDYS